MDLHQYERRLKQTDKAKNFFGHRGIDVYGAGRASFFFEAISADGAADVFLQICAVGFGICGIGLIHTGLLASDERVIKAFNKIRW